jgi:hypothetical protein
LNIAAHQSDFIAQHNGDLSEGGTYIPAVPTTTERDNTELPIRAALQRHDGLRANSSSTPSDGHWRSWTTLPRANDDIACREHIARADGTAASGVNGNFEVAIAVINLRR